MIVALRQIESGEEITYDYGRQYSDYFLEMVAAVVQHAAERVLVWTSSGSLAFAKIIM